jgi:hypothetical protein
VLASSALPPTQQLVYDAMLVAQHAYCATSDQLSLFDMLTLMEVREEHALRKNSHTALAFDCF